MEHLIDQGKGKSDLGQKRLTVCYYRVEQLRLDPRNPRQHSRRQVRQIANSIKAFGFNVPILIDRNLQVIAGHGRVLGARELGWNEVPTISLEHLSEAQARAFTLADNRLAENSVWDDRLLAEQLKALSLLDLDFNLEATGFDMGEIDLRIEGLALDGETQGDAADVLPATEKQTVSRPGDLWLLGRHRLCCGSGIDPSAYALLMDDQRAAIVFTDPPYNVPIDGHACGLGTVRHQDFAMACGEMDAAEFTDFLTRSSRLMVQHSVAGAIHYQCMDWRHVGEMLAVGRRVYTELKNICVWVKHNGGMGSFYRSQHELVFVFKHGRASHRNNIQLGQYGRSRTNVWSYPGVNSFGRLTDEGNLLALHPTVKPVAMVADAILDCSARGDIVLDPFVGSGTTIMAAERVGRRCCAMDIEPLYVDTAIRRWQNFTGTSARHGETGCAFNEVEIERGSQDVT
jgi:DNA modification methylase